MYKQKLLVLLSKIQHLPISVTLPAVAIFATLVAFVAVFLTVKPVEFSYAGNSCIKYPLLFPDLHRLTKDPGFEVYATDRVAIGNVSLASASLCFVPKQLPREGSSQIHLAPFGVATLQKTFALHLPEPPAASADTLARPVPISKNLEIGLSSADKIFTYKLEVGEKSEICRSDEKTLLCDVKPLGLGQGAPYRVKLHRFFKDEQVATLIDQSITTLSATSITDSSVKPGEIIYAKPRTFTVALDKKIAKAEVLLNRVEGAGKFPVASNTTITESGLQVDIVEDLLRQADFELVVSSVEAVDGSGLESPHTIPFKVSGGPKVTGINVGRTGVGLGTTAVISFDQPLSEGQDMGNIVSFGGGAYYAGKRSNQLLVSLKNVPKCGDFNIQINDKLQSSYEISGGNAWSFGGRMVCHSIETIGYSSRGRAINGYFFGSGPRAVLYTGAIHGNEAGTKYLMDRWIQDLEANARSIPGDKTIVVVPQLNPDGVASGSRVNARNVDLNRNFATSDWQKDITDVNNRPFPGGGGPLPMSEPETKAIAGLAQRLRPIMVASYHSIGGVVAGNQAGNSVSTASLYSQLSGYQNVTGSTGETFDYSVTGTADDWYAAMGVPSLLIELSSHTSAQFDRNQKAMWRLVNL